MPDEFVNVIKDLKSKMSEDLHDLSMYQIKLVAPSIIMPLCHIFNLSFIYAYVRVHLEMYKIMPRFKSGDPSSLDNYQPISLLSVFSKFLEKVMCNRLVDCLDEAILFLLINMDSERNTAPYIVSSIFRIKLLLLRKKKYNSLYSAT
jgi:hypothetical protein